MSFSGFNQKIICLDPSCFTSLERLRDAKHVLNQIRSENQTLQVYIPTDIHKTILLQPSEKFAKLPNIIEMWLGDDKYEIHEFEQDQKDEYVFVMREFLQLHNPKPAKDLVGNMEKIGKNSIHLSDLKERFGKTSGKILFEVLAISSEFKAHIIAISERTFSMMKDFGTDVRRGISKVKQELKDRARIRTNLYVAMMFMEFYGILNFIENYKIDGVELPLSILPAIGVIYLANG